MGRLISPPVGLGVVSVEPLSGPRSVAATQSVGNFVQTTASPFGLWRFQIAFRPMNGSEFRAYRGWATALHGGANATRWSFFDPDRITPRESGIDLPHYIDWTSVGIGAKWANDQPWSNDQPWGLSPPPVEVAAPSAIHSTEIVLDDEFWGHSLPVGSYVGFFPFNLGLYMITEDKGDGRYRVWPPLRKAVEVGDYATLDPVLAMRLESEDAVRAGRGLVVSEGAVVTLIETLDYDVRDYFTD